jgi:Flp pilus assembly protein TadD
VLLELGLLDESYAAFEAAFERGASAAIAAHNLALISARRGDMSAARGWAAKAYELAPEDPRVRELWQGVQAQ